MEIATKPNETLRADAIRPLSDAEIDTVDGGVVAGSRVLLALVALVARLNTP